MRAFLIAATLMIAGIARAQGEPASPPPPSNPPAAEPSTAAPPAAPAPAAPAAKPQSFGLIGDIAYEPGVGLRFKTPKTVVVLYGIIEPSISSVSNAAANGAWQTGFQVSWFSGNRWGITGSQSLVKDDSLKAIFRLESEFETPTGNMDTPNVIFNRDAWMGFESVLGKITFGRQNTLARDFAQNYGDPYGTPGVTLEEGGWTNVNNFKQLIFFAGSVTGTRYDDGVVWKRRFGEHVVAGAGFQFNSVTGQGDSGVPGHFDTNTSGSLGLALNLAPVNVSGFFTEANNHGLNQHAVSVGGNYTFSILRVNAGYFHYEALQGASGALGTRSDNAYTVSGTVKLAPIAEGLELSLGYQKIYANNAGYNGGGHTINQFANLAAVTKTGTGAKGTLYGSLVYHFNRATQVYVSSDYMTLTDGYAVGGATAGDFGGASAPNTGVHNSQFEIAIGSRLIF